MPRVSLKGSDKIFTINSGEVLYDALYDQGEQLPHGCLSGSCGACRVEIIEGKENLQAPGVIEKNTIESLKAEFTQTKGKEYVEQTEIRLSCRAKVLGDICIKPIK